MANCRNCNSELLDDIERLDSIHTLYVCLECGETIVLIDKPCSKCGAAPSTCSIPHGEFYCQKCYDFKILKLHEEILKKIEAEEV